MAFYYVTKITRKGKEHAADVAVLPEANKIMITYVNPRYAAEIEGLIKGGVHIYDADGKFVEAIDPNIEPKKWIMNIYKANLGYGFQAEKPVKTNS